MKMKERKVYCTPVCQMVQVYEADYLMETSFPGQHNPGQHGTGPSCAKAVGAWEDVEDENSSGTSSPWED